MERLITTDTDTVTLYRLNPEALLPCTGNQTHRGIFMDTETTSIGPDAKIVELAFVPFFFDDAGNLTGVAKPLTWLQDPGFPIPPEASEVNGITDDMVRGKKIDWPVVQQQLGESQIVLAHNAGFDRPVLHRDARDYKQSLPAVPWGCSMSQVPWKKVIPGVPSVALGALAAWSGFFFSAHRAEMDCLAALYLLHITKQLPVLLRTALAPAILIRISGMYDQREKIKARGYKWDGDRKVWWSSFTEDTIDHEVAWLTLNCYNGRFGGQVIKVPATEAFL